MIGEPFGPFAAQVVGSVTTYLLVLLQLKPSSLGDDHGGPRNRTQRED